MASLKCHSKPLSKFPMSSLDLKATDNSLKNMSNIFQELPESLNLLRLIHFSTYLRVFFLHMEYFSLYKRIMELSVAHIHKTTFYDSFSTFTHSLKSCRKILNTLWRVLSHIKTLEEISYSSSFYPDCVTIIQEQLCKHFQSMLQWNGEWREKNEEEERNLSGKLFDVGEGFFYVATFCLLSLLINYSSNDAFYQKGRITKGHKHTRAKRKINVRCRSKLFHPTNNKSRLESFQHDELYTSDICFVCLCMSRINFNWNHIEKLF